MGRRHKYKRKPSKRRGWAKFLSFLIIGFLSILLGGFLSFAHHVDQLQTPSKLTAADGIVVWTGKGGGRLEAGAKLLMENKGERLLISGVYESNDLDAIRQLTGLTNDMAACCLDLDYAATNTIENARETANWARVLDYDHIILVTSAYHMPRAKAEISNAAGRIRISPYPVERSEKARWFKSWSRTKRLLQEYSKLLLTYARGRGDDRQPPELEIKSEDPKN